VSRILLAQMVVLSGAWALGEQQETAVDVQAVLRLATRAPPLPAPAGGAVRVRSADELRRAVREAKPGTTVLLADGTYPIHELLVTTDRLVLRGASGDRDKVILDGGGRFTKVVRVRGAKDLLIADLTVANSGQYGIVILGDSDVQRLRVYNVVFRNCFVRGLKGTHAARIDDGHRRLRPIELVRKVRPSQGQVRYCLFVNDRVNPHLRPFGGDYIGGIDMMWLKGWTFADNTFVNIRGRRGGGRGAVFLWVNSEDVVVERNLIVNCDRGVCFGNPSGEPWHVTGGIVRNNFILAGTGQGIEVCQTRNTKVYNNTVVATERTDFAVQFHKANPGGQFVNNLVCGKVELAGGVTADSNVVGRLDGWLADLRIGDMHLTARAIGAIGKGRTLPEVTEDFDRHARPDPPDIGADQRRQMPQP